MQKKVYYVLVKTQEYTTNLIEFNITKRSDQSNYLWFNYWYIAIELVGLKGNIHGKYHWKKVWLSTERSQHSSICRSAQTVNPKCSISSIWCTDASSWLMPALLTCPLAWAVNLAPHNKHCEDIHSPYQFDWIILYAECQYSELFSFLRIQEIQLTVKPTVETWNLALHLPCSIQISKVTDSGKIMDDLS